MDDHTTTSTAGSALPFSPVFGHTVDIRFQHDEDFTFTGTPLMRLAQDGYRDASWSLLQGDVDRATREAGTARDMELAYIRRGSADVKAGVR